MFYCDDIAKRMLPKVADVLSVFEHFAGLEPMA